MRRAFTVLSLAIFVNAALPAATIKRRVLIIPFDNMQGNRNYNWMSDSVAENLKTEILKTGNFQVMDAALLRKVNPDIEFGKLTAAEATKLAQRLNCEAAIIGRYFITRKGAKENALLQTEGVDALSRQSVLIKSEYADMDGAIFDHVQKMAMEIAADFNEKLSPISSKDANRDAKLEKLIARLENPPKGFLDFFAIQGGALEPEFDIDAFEYTATLPPQKAGRVREFAFDYAIWGKNFKPSAKGTDLNCLEKKCTLEKQDSELILEKPGDKNGPRYRVKIRAEEPPPFVGTWWVTAGYPLAKSLALPNNANPAAMLPDQPLPLDALRGVLSLDFGFAFGRWQLPAGMRWALGGQFFYGRGDFPQYLANYTPTVGMNLLSLGGGLRVDRPFMIGKWYGISPLIGFYVHYQRYFRNFSGEATQTMALVPEIGVAQYIRLGAGSKWRLVLQTVAGGFFYKTQNVSYVRINLGVEYAFK